MILANSKYATIPSRFATTPFATIPSRFVTTPSRFDSYTSFPQPTMVAARKKANNPLK